MIRRIPIMKASMPYQAGMLGSFDKTQNMLVRQHNFPAEWVKGVDEYINAYSDRCRQWDWDHTSAAYKRHVEGRFEGWCRQASPEAIMAFLIDVLKVEEHHPGVEWTGFRVLGCVNVSNGYEVFVFELFANRSNVETYSGDIAPNVETLKSELLDDYSFYRRGHR